VPHTDSKPVRIYWEEEGQGDPLLMIMGLGFSLAMWRDMRSWMARHFRTIVFDNRGIARSGPEADHSCGCSRRTALH
jgi:pimeloyl-ACP methyl ester carboxylesterase